VTAISARQFAQLKPPGAVSSVLTITRRELRDAIASRWFLLYSLTFSGLGLCVSYVSATSLGGSGLAGFGRTSAGLINLVLLVVPLMALTTGAGAIAGDRERGTLAYLVAQPVRRIELLLGKTIALALAMALSICIGFGLSATVLATQGSATDFAPFMLLVALTAMLAMSMLSIGILISTLCRRTGVAIGIAIFVWLVLVFATDLGLMAGALATSISIEWLFKLAVISPLQAFKMWSLQSVDASLDVLGPAGLFAQREYGTSLDGLFAIVLVVWTILPLALAGVIFSKRSPL
jgi:Cu-processing system permease protein